jgi:hypothetical protein
MFIPFVGMLSAAEIFLFVQRRKKTINDRFIKKKYFTKKQKNISV